MVNERSPAEDTGSAPETWSMLKELISEYEPDVSVMRRQLDRVPPPVVQLRQRRHREPQRGRSTVLASAAAVLLIACGVVVGTHGLGSAGNQTPLATSLPTAVQTGTAVSSLNPTATPSATPDSTASIEQRPSPGTTLRPTQSASTKAQVPLIRASGTPAGKSITGFIQGVQSGQCVDVPGAAQTNGTITELWNCGNTPNQTWTLTPAKQLTIYDGAKCLDVAGQGTGNATPVQIWDCNGGANQQWTIKADGTIVGVGSGKCLDAAGQGESNGTVVQIWTCNGGANQKWLR